MRPPRTHPYVAGFDRAAGLYERGRPGYPPALVRYLGRTLRVGPGRTVIDLASGTGKFTRAILPLGAAVVAVEPTAGMREVFERVVPTVPVVDGTAESIPLPEGFADAVVTAQAFHWFRPRPAMREIARVLRPGGGLGLVWNIRDDTRGWTRHLSAIFDRYGHPGPRTRDRGWKAAFEDAGSPFSRLHHRVFRHSQEGTPATVVARALSISRIAILPPSERAAVAREVRTLLRTDPTSRGRSLVTMPYKTELFWCRKKGRSSDR